MPALIIALIFTGCTKEGEVITQQKNTKTNASNSETKKKELRQYYYLHNMCLPPSQNCASEDVIIKPHFADGITSMLTGSTAVVNYFNGTEWQENFPDVADDAVLLGDLRSGFFTIEDNLNTATNVHYYIVTDAGTGQVRFVFPLVFE